MSAFVVLSIAVAIAILAVTVVVAVRLGRAAASMAAEVKATAERIRPLTQELTDEAAVTQIELAQLQERVGRLRGGQDSSTRLHLTQATGDTP